MGLLYQIEKLCVKLRHSATLKGAAPLWAALRPVYNRLVSLAGRGGLVRHINGTDTIRLAPECRGLGETYEPEVWASVMQHIKPGSRVIDVGAHYGLYAVAFGLRVGASGRVLAAEPDPENLRLLHQHIALNGLQSVVTVVPAAMSDHAGTASLSMDSLQSHVSESGALKIELQTLDAATGNGKWDLLLVDVEGHEEKVLRGAHALLGDPARRPGMIVIEVHPYAWADLGTTADSLLSVLREHGYEVRTLDGQKVSAIERYGHIVATINL